MTVNTTDDVNARNNELSIREAILLSEGTLQVAQLTAAEQAQVANDPNSNGNIIRFDIGEWDQTSHPSRFRRRSSNDSQQTRDRRHLSPDAGVAAHHPRRFRGRQ
jgi:hypothetical protein